MRNDITRVALAATEPEILQNEVLLRGAVKREVTYVSRDTTAGSVSSRDPRAAGAAENPLKSPVQCSPTTNWCH